MNNKRNYYICVDLYISYVIPDRFFAQLHVSYSARNERFLLYALQSLHYNVKSENEKSVSLDVHCVHVVRPCYLSF